MIKPQTCPICDKELAGQSEAFPFCSERCQKVDFFRWCDGRYAIVEPLDPQVAELLAEEPEFQGRVEDVERG